MTKQHPLPRLLICGALFACTAHTAAQTQWPDFMPSLQWVPARSPYSADLPDDVKIIPPGSHVPPNRTVWLGVWRGWACLNAVCDTRLAVEEIRPDGITIVYAFANQARKSSYQRAQATFKDDELVATLSNRAVITYRIRTDGNLDFLYRRGESDYVAGVLRREK